MTRSYLPHYFILNYFCLVLSCLVLSGLVLSYLVSSCLFFSCLVLSCLVCSYLKPVRHQKRQWTWERKPVCPNPIPSPNPNTIRPLFCLSSFFGMYYISVSAFVWSFSLFSVCRCVSLSICFRLSVPYLSVCSVCLFVCLFVVFLLLSCRGLIRRFSFCFCLFLKCRYVIFKVELPKKLTDRQKEVT